MPYKDKTKQKQAVLKAVHKHRAVIPANVIPDDVIPDRAEFTRKPIKPSKLPDTSILPQERIDAIQNTLQRRQELVLDDDSQDRYQRAIDYRHYELINHPNIVH